MSSFLKVAAAVNTLTSNKIYTNKEQNKFASTPKFEITPARFFPLSYKLKSFQASLQTNFNMQKASNTSGGNITKTQNKTKTTYISCFFHLDILFVSKVKSYKDQK